MRPRAPFSSTTGLWATGRLAAILNERFGCGLDLGRVAPDRFASTVYPEWFLGSQGKKVTLSGRLLRAVRHAFVGWAGLVTCAAKGLLFDSKMHDSERTADSILRKAEAAAWPLSYAAELVAKAVRENA